MDFQSAAAAFEQFVRGGLGRRVAQLESAVSRRERDEILQVLNAHHVDEATLDAALTIKSLAGEVNVVIHTLGILASLPHILEPGERIDYVSLGAGNTGRPFDLETDRRVAEFKFITWRGGAEAIRQNQLFKDFYLLAESNTPKRKELYVTGAHHPLRFLSGGRALSSVLSRNSKLAGDFRARYGDRFGTVREYFAYRESVVAIRDLGDLLPAMFGTSKALEALGSEYQVSD